MPLVSVIMSVYNGERYLQAAIESILEQTYTDFEFIVVNDASTDASPVVIDLFSDTRIRRIDNSTNLGLTRSLNAAFAVANGEYIARQDADDISYPNRLDRQVNYLDTHPGIGLLGTGYDIINWKGTILDRIIPPATDPELRARLDNGNVFCHGSVMIRRSCLEMVGGYRAEFPVTQDYDLWLRLSEHSDLASLPDILYGYRFDAEAIGRTKRDLQLAYKFLALEFASRRRHNLPEGSIPENVLIACPPEPEKLLASALASVYLLFASDENVKAGEALEKALGIVEKYGLNMDWQLWALNRANWIASLRNSIQEGEKLINWLGKRVINNGLARRTLAHFYIDQAFILATSGRKREAINFVLRAIRHDINWLRNKGVLSLIFRGLFSNHISQMGR